MIKLVKSKLDEYIEFDSDELFNEDKNNLVRIFGGSIRDSICGDKINDIDILCGSSSMTSISKLIESKGYIFMSSLVGKDLSSLYADIHCISEPHTYMKGTKIIQLIRPFSQSDILRNGDVCRTHLYSETYKDAFINLIRNVDMSCCGVSYDKNGLYENYENAISHCLHKKFIVNKNALMYSQKRFIHRTIKLENRGWEEVKKEDIRDLKIDILFDNKYQIYTTEY